jgi:hypothetical protein
MISDLLVAPEQEEKLKSGLPHDEALDELWFNGCLAQNWLIRRKNYLH